MAKADIAAGRAYVSLFVKNDMTKALNKAKQELNDFGSSILGVGTKVAGMGAVITGGLTAAVMHFANVGSELNDMSARTGISTTALAELGHAAGMTGTEMASVESSVKKMQKNLGGIGPESKKAQEALAAMGLTMGQISGLAPEDQFQAIAERIGSIEDPSRQAAAAMAIFGGSGTDILPMMQNIRELRQEARDLGIAPSPESIAAADAIGDAIDRVRAVVSSAVFEIGAAMAPMATDILNGFLIVAKAVKKFVVENRALVVTAAKVGVALLVAGTAIAAIGGAFIFAGAAIGGMMSVMAAFGAAAGVVTSVIAAAGSAVMAILSPVGLLAAALVAGVYAWARFTESGREAVSGLATIVSEVFGGIMTTVSETMGGIIMAIQAGDLSLAGQIAMIGLQLVFLQGLETIHKLFGDTIGTIIGQIVNGDLAGAWETTTAALTITWDAFSTNIVERFREASESIMAIWRETAGFLNDNILDYLSAATGKDLALGGMSRGKKRLGDPAPSPPGAAPKSPEVAQAEKVLEDATTGQAAAASEAVKALQAELASLRAQASGKVAAMNAGAAESGGKGFGAGGGSLGKASAASFSLAALAMSAGRGGFEQKQLAASQKTNKLQEEANKIAWQTMNAVAGWGMHHP